MHLPPQQPNRFVNGSVEHLQGVLGYSNEPKTRETDDIEVLRRG